MIVVTSLSPSHSNSASQHKSVASWQSWGTCYSLNSKKEIDTLAKELYEGIEFIETTKTLQSLFTKPTVSIFGMIEFAIGRGEDLFLINSDILIEHLPEFNQDGITMFSRYDYVNNYNEATRFENGYDAFFVPNKFLSLFPFSIYAMGNCFWDYWLPFVCHLNNIPTYYPNGKFTFHKVHPVQYPLQEYYDLGRHFQWEFKIDRRLSPSQVAAWSLEMIKQKLIKY